MKRSMLGIVGAGLVATLGCGHLEDPVPGSHDFELLREPSAAPSWAVPYAAEFWRRDTRAVPAIAIDRVVHALRATDRAGELVVRDAGFVARYDARGLEVASPAGGAVGLRTSRIALGGTLVYAADAPTRWSVLGNTAQALRDPALALVEHHAISAEGVELSWVLGARTTGDFVVDIDLEPRGLHAEGAQLVDAAGRPQLRIGDAVLADAAGTRWPIATEHTLAGLRWRVPAETLAMATLPVALDPTVGPAIDVAPGLSQMEAPALASNGGGYLVVMNVLTASSATEVVATRVTSAGAIQDVGGLVLGTLAPPLAVTRIAAGSNGSDYLVAWGDAEAGNHIYAARVTAAGATPDATPLVLTTTKLYGPITNTVRAPAIAAVGADYLVAWADTRCGSVDPGNLDFPCHSPEPGVWGTRVTSAGVVLDPAGIPIGTSSNYRNPPNDPMLAASSSAYLATWSAYPTYQGCLLSSAGSPTFGPVTFATSGATGAGFANAASNGTDFFVAWTTASEVRGARLTAAGAIPPADAGGVLLAQAAAFTAATASDGTDYLVVYGTTGSAPVLVGERVSASTGAVLPADVGGFPVASGVENSGWRGDALTGGAGLPYLVGYLAPRATVRQIETTSSTCGNGSLDANEACDDGNLVSHDGCSTVCTLEPGFTCSGTPTTCTDIDECSTSNGGCAQTCTNTPGSFTCGCTSGYTLAADQHSCADVNECATNNGGCAVTCTNSIGSYSCSCLSGFVLAADGHGCTDVDECATGNGGCAQTCTNTVGSYACSCGSGYTLATNGLGCTDIDECATNNGGCAQTCTNTPGGFTCSCATGYGGPSCTDIDECATGNGGCAQTCTNSVGAYACSCGSGFTLDADGHHCDDVDECATANGGCAQLCTNTPGGFACGCTSGFALSADQRTCNDIDECATHADNCSADATCINATGSFACICEAGFVGDGVTCTIGGGAGGCSTTGGEGSLALGLGAVALLLRRRRR